MEDKKNFGFGTQIRKSPYFNSTGKIMEALNGVQLVFQFIITCIFLVTLVLLNKTFGI